MSNCTFVFCRRIESLPPLMCCRPIRVTSLRACPVSTPQAARCGLSFALTVAQASAQARHHVGQANTEQRRDVAVRRPMPVDVGRADGEDDRALQNEPHQPHTAGSIGGRRPLASRSRYQSSALSAYLFIAGLQMSALRLAQCQVVQAEGSLT
jgi:hypothetical protein